jgi:glucose-6-phosphate isomerase
MHQPTLSTAAFQALQTHHTAAAEWQLRELFLENPSRAATFSIEAANLVLDYSKNPVADTTMQHLFTLARERKVEQQRNAMFSGEKINVTEHRAVLHTALRMPSGKSLYIDNQDIIPEIHAVLERMRVFTDNVRSGTWLGYTGKAITDIVNIGVGGSDLGPEMVCCALRSFVHPGLNLHFVANIDSHDLNAVLSKIDPETTLFIISSKTFTTLETMMNAQSARTWFLHHATMADMRQHFIAVSAHAETVTAFGIAPENMFPFWDWVGGRYSIWSAIGLSIALAIGFAGFQEFLGGAHAMDQHFLDTPLERNMPVVLALIGVWHRNFFGRTSVTIAPYHQDLHHFPAYLQQLEMESNGKRVTLDGKVLDVASCPIIWGDVGTNGQHAYFQLLHQGTDITPIDFIVPLQPNHDLPGHHAVLLANCFAQSEAFMRGKTADEVRADMRMQGLADADIEALVPHRTFPGNRPSNTILMDKLTPATLGALIALYEHKVFVQGVLWGINSFDQWGVELGKILARNIHTELTGSAHPEQHDSSTNALIARARKALQRR